MADLKRGQIVWCDLEEEPRAGEAGRRRPVLIVSSNRMSPAGPAVIVPLTSTPRAYPTVIELTDCLPRTSYLQCEQVRAVSRARLGALIATVDPAVMRRVEAVLRRILEL